MFTRCRLPLISKCEGSGHQSELSGHRMIRQLLPMSLVSLAASFALFAIVYYLEQKNAADRFRELAGQRLITIRTNMAIADNAVSMLVGHFAVSPDRQTSREHFRHLVAPALEAHAFVQGFSWDPRVRRDQLADYERLARQDGLDQFRIFERDADGKPRPVAERPEYVPIFYMEPQAANLRALGFDLASHPVRRQALEAARDKGQPQATGRITLVQEQGDQYGVLVLAPVFGMQGPGDADSNRRALTGYVSGVFRIGDLIQSIGGLSKDKSLQQMVDIHLFDQSAALPDRLLYPKGSQQDAATLMGGLHVVDDLTVGGRSWQLIATPSPGYQAATRPLGSYVMLGVALLASLFYLFYLKGRITQAENATAFARTMAEARRRLGDAQRIARLSALEVNPETGQVQLEDGAATMLGLDPEVTDLPCAHIHACAWEADRPLWQALLNGEQPEAEIRVGTQSQTRTLLGRAAGGQGHRIITIQDISGRKQAEEERATMISRIAESDRLEALGTLAGGIAHEINTPTQYVGDNLAFLQDGIGALLDLAVRVPEQAAQQGLDVDFLAAELPAAAEQALDGTRRIAHIVQAIKEFSYPSSRTPHPFDLNHMIDVVTTVTRNQWKYVAELDLHLDGNLPKVDGIEGEINQVLVNLIVNAAQAMAGQQRDRPGRITIRTRSLPEGCELVFQDDGPGIAPQHLRQVFEMFFTTKAPGQGTGQGLAIAKAIILRHGGQISVESEPGQGACFRIQFPATFPHSAPSDQR